MSWILTPPFFVTGSAPRTPKHPFVATCPRHASPPRTHQRSTNGRPKGCQQPSRPVGSSPGSSAREKIRGSGQRGSAKTRPSLWATTNLSHPFPDEICASERPLQRCRKVLYGQSDSPVLDQDGADTLFTMAHEGPLIFWARAVVRRQLAPRRRMAAAWRRQIHATKKSYDKHARWLMSAPAHNGSVNRFLTLSVRQSGALVRRVPGESQICLFAQGFRLPPRNLA